MKQCCNEDACNQNLIWSRLSHLFTTVPQDLAPAQLAKGGVSEKQLSGDHPGS